MENGSKKAVTFYCRTRSEADLIYRAVRAYKRVITDRGDDPRNYAPAVPGYAGFGWDAMERMARDLGACTTTYMSNRMAEAMREALEAYKSETVNRDDGVIILDATYRLNMAMDGGE